MPTRCPLLPLTLSTLFSCTTFTSLQPRPSSTAVNPLRSPQNPCPMLSHTTASLFAALLWAVPNSLLPTRNPSLHKYTLLKLFSPDSTPPFTTAAPKVLASSSWTYYVSALCAPSAVEEMDGAPVRAKGHLTHAHTRLWRHHHGRRDNSLLPTKHIISKEQPLSKTIEPILDVLAPLPRT